MRGRRRGSDCDATPKTPCSFHKPSSSTDDGVVTHVLAPDEMVGVVDDHTAATAHKF